MMTSRPKVFKKGRKQRDGRGFSREELRKAGLSFKEALKLSIPIDSKRRTAHEENVKVIQTLMKNMKTETKHKKKSELDAPNRKQ